MDSSVSSKEFHRENWRTHNGNVGLNFFVVVASSLRPIFEQKHRLFTLRCGGECSTGNTRQPARSSHHQLPCESSNDQWVGWLTPRFLDAAFLFHCDRNFFRT